MSDIKQIKASISSPISEVAKDKLIAAAGVHPGAANVIRDANGKVTEVQITLPATAAAAAAAAIAATPGVANVVTGDLIPGTVGLDGTQATYDSLLSQGFFITTGGTGDIAITYNADGTTTYTCPDGQSVGSRGLDKSTDAVPNSPVPISFEMKMKFTGTCQMSWHFSNGTLSAECGFQAALPDTPAEGLPSRLNTYDNVNGGSYGTWVQNSNDDSLFHIYKWSFGSTGVVTTTKDGNLLATRQLNVSAVDTGNTVGMGISVYSGGSFTIDYARWTQL
jgi:hypothetical protein